jgi:hypothetical protein
VRNDHPLIGMFFHSFKDNGAYYFQGQIIGVDGDVVLAQLFSWWDGGPTQVEKIAKSYIYSDRVTLYSCNEDMNIAWQKHCDAAKARGEEIGIDRAKVRVADTEAVA